MKKLALLFLAASIGSAFARQVTINFDDLPPTANGLTSLPVPANYEGLSWTGSWQYYSGVQTDNIGNPIPQYNPSSFPSRAYEFTPSFIDFGGPVTFQGSFFNGFGSTFPGNAYWVGYDKNGDVIHTSALYDNATDPSDGTGEFAVLNWANVYSVGLFATGNPEVDGYGFFIVDDIKYTPGATAPDAGSTGVLLAIGFGGLAFLRRKLA